MTYIKHADQTVQVTHSCAPEEREQQLQFWSIRSAVQCRVSADDTQFRASNVCELTSSIASSDSDGSGCPPAGPLAAAAPAAPPSSSPGTSCAQRRREKNITHFVTQRELCNAPVMRCGRPAACNGSVSFDLIDIP